MRFKIPSPSNSIHNNNFTKAMIVAYTFFFPFLACSSNTAPSIVNKIIPQQLVLNDLQIFTHIHTNMCNSFFPNWIYLTKSSSAKISKSQQLGIKLKDPIQLIKPFIFLLFSSASVKLCAVNGKIPKSLLQKQGLYLIFHTHYNSVFNLPVQHGSNKLERKADT